jgi:hypothetical protein
VALAGHSLDNYISQLELHMAIYFEPTLGSFTLEEAMQMDISACEVPWDTKIVPVDALLKYMQETAATIRAHEQELQETEEKIEELMETFDAMPKRLEELKEQVRSMSTALAVAESLLDLEAQVKYRERVEELKEQ